MIIDLERYSSEYPKDFARDKLQEIKSRFIDGDLSAWMKTENYISKEELNEVHKLSSEIRAKSEVLLVIGIGGSYMGSKAIYEALKPRYITGKPELIFLGTNLDPKYYEETLDYLEDKEIYVNLISKSGNTLEPSLAFDLVLDLMDKKYGTNAKERILITTDAESGKLRTLVNEENYKSLVVPKEIGGRFSVFTVVALLSLAVAGVDIEELLRGAKDATNLLDEAIDYSYRRKDFEVSGRTVESFTIYDENLLYLSEWLKQLFGETQGKESKGILPIYNLNTRDLHSMGQFIQEGNKIVFETVISVLEQKGPMIDKYSMRLSEVNNLVAEAVAIAHEKGGCPSIYISLEKLDEYNLAKLMQFFILASITGALIDGVNPFDQPGVEEYKKNVSIKLEGN